MNDSHDEVAVMENQLVEEAARMGVSLSEYVARLLAAGKSAEAAPRNGAELVAYWKREGLIGTRPEIEDAAAHSRELRTRAECRERE